MLFWKAEIEITLVIFFFHLSTLPKQLTMHILNQRYQRDLLRFITANKNFFSPYNEGVSLDKTSRTVQLGCVKYCEHFMSV